MQHVSAHVNPAAGCAHAIARAGANTDRCRCSDTVSARLTCAPGAARVAQPRLPGSDPLASAGGLLTTCPLMTLAATWRMVQARSPKSASAHTLKMLLFLRSPKENLGLQARATAAGGEVTAAMLNGLGADFQPRVGAIADFSFNLNCGTPDPASCIAPWSTGALL